MLSLDHLTTPIVLHREPPTYANDLISVSRVKRFEQCPSSFEMRYVQRLKSEPGLPLHFGNLMHDTLETTMTEIVDAKIAGPFPKEMMMEVYREAFEKNEHISEFEIFEEGRHILVDYAARNGIVDYARHIGIEQRFELPLAGWNFLGFMDRVDDLGDDHINIRDYKTNRVLFDRDQVDSDLQASIYTWAAKQLYPNAKKISFTFDMLRHGIDMRTDRDDEQIESACNFVESLMQQSEAGPYPARLNEFCAWCDQRNGCSMYQDALATDDEKLAELFIANPKMMDEVTTERERVNYIFKLLKGRKEELEKLIKARIKLDGPIVSNGLRYSINKAKYGRKFPGSVIAVLAAKAKLDEHEVRDKVTSIDAKKVDTLVKKCAKDMNAAEAKMLKVEIDAMAESGYQSRFSARKEK